MVSSIACVLVLDDICDWDVIKFSRNFLLTFFILFEFFVDVIGVVPSVFIAQPQIIFLHYVF